MAIISRTLTYASGTIYGEAMLVVSMRRLLNIHPPAVLLVSNYPMTYTGAWLPSTL